MQVLSSFVQQGLTKDIQFRKDQLQSLARFIDENLVGLQDALRQDLHKHQVESSVGEIIPIRNECDFMLKVSFNGLLREYQ